MNRAMEQRAGFGGNLRPRHAGPHARYEAHDASAAAVGFLLGNPIFEWNENIGRRVQQDALKAGRRDADNSVFPLQTLETIADGIEAGIVVGAPVAIADQRHMEFPRGKGTAPRRADAEHSKIVAGDGLHGGLHTAAMIHDFEGSGNI